MAYVMTDADRSVMPTPKPKVTPTTPAQPQKTIGELIKETYKPPVAPTTITTEPKVETQKVETPTTTNTIASTIANGGTPVKEEPKVATYEKAADNSAMINSQAESMASAIRAQIAQRNQEIQGRITSLPDKYQPDKNASEVAKAQQVRSLNEIAANQGDRGGIGRQNTLAAMVGGENRLNTVNLAQKQEEAALNNEIGRLMLEGDIQQANIQAQKLRDLIANNTAMNNTNYERQFNAEGRQQTQSNADRTYNRGIEEFTTSQNNWNKTFDANQSISDRNYKLGLAESMGKTYDMQGNLIDSAATTRQNTQDAIVKTDREKKEYLESIKNLGNQFDYAGEIQKIIDDNDTSNDWKISGLKQEKEAKEISRLQNDIQTIGQYSSDYQKEINKRQPNDRLLPYLLIAQAQKLQTINSAKLTAQEVKKKEALNLWEKTGIADEYISSVLGLPVGTTTMDFTKTLNDTRKTNYDVSKPYYNPNSGGGGSEKFDSNRNFTIDDLNSNFKAMFIQPEIDSDGEKTGRSVVDKAGIADALFELENSGADEGTLQNLIRAWAISPADLKASESRTNRKSAENYSNELKNNWQW